MIISCPNCTSRFNLNAELLGETGRNVKCAKCAHRWFAKPSDGSAAAPSPAEAPAPPPPPVAPPPPAAPLPPAAKKPPAKSPAPEEDAPKKAAEETTDDDSEPEESPSPPPIPTEEEIAQFQSRPPPAKSMLVWWVALFLVIVGIVSSTIYLRRDIAAFYPPSNRLFLAIGLPTDTLGYGLKILDPKTTQRSDGNDRILVIKGEIENETGNVIDIPLLRGTVKNTRGKELFVWSFKTKEPRVLAGEKNTYETEVRNPPPGSTQLSITFTRESEMMAEKEKAKAASKSTKPKPKK